MGNSRLTCTLKCGEKDEISYAPEDKLPLWDLGADPQNALRQPLLGSSPVFAFHSAIPENGSCAVFPKKADLPQRLSTLCSPGTGKGKKSKGKKARPELEGKTDTGQLCLGRGLELLGGGRKGEREEDGKANSLDGSAHRSSQLQVTPHEM